MTNDTAPALGVGQIRMDRDMPFNFRFSRLDQQLPGTGPQDVRQRIVGKCFWLAKRYNCIFFYGVSLFFGKSASHSTPRYATFNSPSPSSAIARGYFICSIIGFCQSPCDALAHVFRLGADCVGEAPELVSQAMHLIEER